MFDSEEVVRSFMPDWTRTNGNQVSIAFECANPAEVDEVYARVVAAGFEGEKAPWDADWGQRYALLGDPDGVRVNLYARLPKGSWPGTRLRIWTRSRSSTERAVTIGRSDTTWASQRSE